LVDIARIRRQWLAAVEEAAATGNPRPTVLWMRAPSTFLAMDAMCELATVDFHEVKEQLANLVIWADGCRESIDTTECQKDILR
jgi:hypothetical protein